MEYKKTRIWKLQLCLCSLAWIGTLDRAYTALQIFICSCLCSCKVDTKFIIKLLYFWKRGNPRITMAAAELCTETVGDEELYDSPRKRKEAASPKTPYYLRNFLAILNHVLQNAHNWSLFSEQELSLLRSFSDLQGKI